MGAMPLRACYDVLLSSCSAGCDDGFCLSRYAALTLLCWASLRCLFRYAALTLLYYDGLQLLDMMFLFVYFDLMLSRCSAIPSRYNKMHGHFVALAQNTRTLRRPGITQSFQLCRSGGRCVCQCRLPSDSPPDHKCLLLVVLRFGLHLALPLRCVASIQLAH